MPNKRPPRNAYVFFVMEMMPELRRRGLPVKGLRDAVPHCSEEWALLSPEEKEKYAEMARLWKNSDPEPSTSKNSHPDQVFGQRKVQGKAALVPTLTEKAVVQLDASSKRNQGSAESVFYFLHILSHGELPSHCDQRFLPCEIACVRYSLHDGLMGSFHHFIDPGEIPRGFRFQCQAASTATHQIPISGFELTNSDYHNLFRELCGFVCPAPGTWPPVYCKVFCMFYCILKAWPCKITYTSEL